MPTTTRSEVRPRVCRALGGRTGSISSGGAEFAVLGGLTGVAYDAHAFTGWLLVMPDAANATDRERIVTGYDAAAGRVDWVGARTDVTYTSETFELYPPGVSLDDVNSALGETLDETGRAVVVHLPTIEGERNYTLRRLSWLETRSDVLAVFRRGSPNLLGNAGFELWRDGPAAAPALWTLTGAGAAVARAASTQFFGGYAAQVTRAGTNCYLEQVVGLLNRQLNGKTVTVGCWVVSGTASSARLIINDGVGTTASSYHTGGGAAEFLSASRAIDAAASTLSVRLQVEQDETVDFDNAQLVERSSVHTELRDYTDTRFRRTGQRYELLDGLDAPVVELDRAPSRGAQLEVWSRSPFPTVSSDSEVIDAQRDLLVHGTVYRLARRHAEGEERTKWDRLMQEHRGPYAHLAARALQIPVPDEQEAAEVRSI